MQEDFHYYATYCAAMLAGFTHEESLDICYSAQFVDVCSATLLSKMIQHHDNPIKLEKIEKRGNLRMDIKGAFQKKSGCCKRKYKRKELV